jgi:hypothetical protein
VDLQVVVRCVGCCFEDCPDPVVWVMGCCPLRAAGVLWCGPPGCCPLIVTLLCFILTFSEKGEC